MKIKQLEIAGFRSLKKVSWQPGDLNVVIGQNGTGKSNLLRMLEMISAAAQGQLSKYVQAAGGIDAIEWDGTAGSVSFILTVESSNSTTGNQERYALWLDSDPFSYEIKRESWLSIKTVNKSGPPQEVTNIARDYQRVLFDGKQLSEKPGVSLEETVLSLLNSLSFSEGDDFERSYEAYIFRGELAGLTVYHDLNVGQDTKIRQATIARLEKRIDADGQNLTAVMHTLYSGNREFKQKIDAAMRAAFGPDYEEIVFPPAADQRVQLRVRWKTLRREQSAADLSDGTLRFLLLLAIFATPDPPSLIAVDEPETGLHPAMLPIIAEHAVEAATRTQVVLTTHSPQFLDAFTRIKPVTTVAKWENGETTLHTLAGEELAYWLEDYSLGRLFESGQLEAMT